MKTTSSKTTRSTVVSKTAKGKVSEPITTKKADVLSAIKTFLSNPPTDGLTMKQIYSTIGFEHRQVYLMIREKGKIVGKVVSSEGKGKKPALYLFEKEV